MKDRKTLLPDELMTSSILKSNTMNLFSTSTRNRISQSSYWIILLLLYAIAASQTVWSFSYKWTTVVNDRVYPLTKTLNNNIPKPYAYRVLYPTAINAIATELVPILPATVQNVLHERSKNMADAALIDLPPLDQSVIIPYGLIAVFNFLMFFGTLLCLRALANKILLLPARSLTSDAGPLAFALLLTISYRANNGFIYDFAELLLFCGYILSVVSSRPSIALTILAISVLNKESAILYPIFGLLIRWNQDKDSKRVGMRTVQEGLIAGALYVFLKLAMRDLPGSTAEWHFPTNIKFWLSLEPFLAVTTPHMQLVLLPKPTNLLVLVPLLICISAFWHAKPLILRRLLLAATLINLPLFILFCYQDELRNLSLMYPFLFLSSLHTLQRFYHTGVNCSSVEFDERQQISTCCTRLPVDSKRETGNAKPTVSTIT